MPTNSTTTAIIVGVGALTDFVMRGKWTWREFIISTGFSVAGFFFALIILNAIPFFSEASSDVRIGVAYFCGLFVRGIISRVNKLTVKASVGGVEVSSSGDDK